jgi:hypothetical protein
MWVEEGKGGNMGLILLIKDKNKIYIFIYI